MVGYFRYVFGSETTTETLTGSLATGSKNILLEAGNKDELVMYVLYTPAANGSTLFLEVAFSVDGGTNFVNESIAVDNTPASNQVITDQYPKLHRLTGTTSGITYGVRIPVALAESNAYGGQFTRDVMIRIRAYETTSGSFGTLRLGASLLERMMGR